MYNVNTVCKRVVKEIGIADVFPSENSRPSSRIDVFRLRILVCRFVFRPIVLLFKHDFYRVCNCKELFFLTLA
jgi:hypothetical protein